MSDQINYEQIRERAEKRVKQRAEFNLHLGIYLIVNVTLWVIFGLIAAFTGNTFLLIPAILSTFGWGLGVAIHWLTMYMNTSAMEAMREREIQREIDREMQLRGLTRNQAEQVVYEKPKRDRVARLADDGELNYEDGVNGIGDAETNENGEARRSRRQHRS